MCPAWVAARAERLAAAGLSDRPAAIAEHSLLVTVTNGAEYRAPSYLDGWWRADLPPVLVRTAVRVRG